MVAARRQSDIPVLKDGALPQTPLKAAPKALGQARDVEPHAGCRAGDVGDGALPQTPLRRARRDALPEHTQYADTGCDVHPSCFTCPLVRCRYDEPGGARRLLSEGRDRQIVAMQRSGEAINQIARRFGVSRRTVFRVLARSRSSA